MGLGDRAKLVAWAQWHGKLAFRREGGVLFVRIDLPDLGQLWLQVPDKAVPMMGWPRRT